MNAPTQSVVATLDDQGVATVTREVEPDVDEHWKPTGPGIALRLLAAVVLAYFTIVGGAFADGPWAQAMRTARDLWRHRTKLPAAGWIGLGSAISDQLGGHLCCWQ